MNLKELQSIAEEIGGVVVLENGKPKFIVLTYEKFAELNDKKRKSLKVKNEESDAQVNLSLNSNPSESMGESIKNNKNEIMIENLNKEISALREEIESKEKELDLTPTQD